MRQRLSTIALSCTGLRLAERDWLSANQQQMADNLSAERFRPHQLLRNAHLQSILPSLPPRRWHTQRRAQDLRQRAIDSHVDCEGLATLKVSLTRASGLRRDGERIALLLHGWEGNSDSSYVLSLGALLLEQGFDVARLNLRDHGGTQALNRELFHSCRLPEVRAAVQVLARQHPAARVYLAGFSLGGNFLLRTAAAGVPANVAGVVAISPVLDPAHAMSAMEQGLPVYQRYFVARWARSLRHKQQCWPTDYDFGELLSGRSLRDMTRELVSRHTSYSDMASYLAGYAITGDRLGSLTVPARILAAADDPIIPAADLSQLATPACLRVQCESHGGHCGFIDQYHGVSYADRYVLSQFQAF
jgi:predicted alpha/beta-fold hydrolase